MAKNEMVERAKADFRNELSAALEGTGAIVKVDPSWCCSVTGVDGKSVVLDADLHDDLDVPEDQWIAYLRMDTGVLDARFGPWETRNAAEAVAWTKRDLGI